jgi:type I restriction enzyme S subunit
VALPSPSEQRRIEERLQFSNARIETLQIERDKLRLVKQGLMHDLLAGRVRVKIEELAAT